MSQFFGLLDPTAKTDASQDGNAESDETLGTPPAIGMVYSSAGPS